MFYAGEGCDGATRYSSKGSQVQSGNTRLAACQAGGGGAGVIGTRDRLRDLWLQRQRVKRRGFWRMRSRHAVLNAAVVKGFDTSMEVRENGKHGGIAFK
jgi:hypothetical protein